MIPQEDKPRSPFFLERHSYRRRRLVDAVRLVPILGILLFLVPLLWPRGPEGGVSTSSAVVYLFAVWIGLSVLKFILAIPLRGAMGESQEGGGE